MSSLVPSSPGLANSFTYKHDHTVVCVKQEAADPRLADFTQELEGRKKIDGYEPERAHLEGSNLPVGDMETNIKIGIIESSHKTSWKRASESGCVASNLDRSTPHVQMLRVWTSSGRSTNYLGRADTQDRLKEQVEFMLTQEFALADGQWQEVRGLHQDTDGSYTFSYFVNSLTKSGKFQETSNLDERESLILEKDLLKKNHTFTFTINGQELQVKVKPIHIHQNISDAGELLSNLFDDDLNGKNLDAQINEIGYKNLFEKVPDRGALTQGSLETQLKEQLENQELSVRERFIFTDFLQRAAGLCAVYHCKSSVDRGGVAAAIGATNQYFIDKEDQNLTFERLKVLINSEEYREMFFAQLCRSHQETYPARYGRNEHGAITGKQTLGLKMYGSLLTDSLPADMVKETLWEKSKGVRVLVTAIATAAYILLYPVIVVFMLVIGHLFLGIYQLGLLAKKGKSVAGRLRALHAASYAFTPWKIHKAAHKHINYSSTVMNRYGIIA